MAGSTIIGDSPVPAESLDGAEQDYSRDLKYVYIAIFLAVVTAVEVMTYVTPEFILWDWGGSTGLIVALMLMMAVKFWVVAWYFMHLKFDKRILTAVFYAGLVLAVAVYLAVMTAFRLWWPESHS